LAIVGYITTHQDQDKPMPSHRIAAIWDALYEEGSIERPHCFKRAAAIRNHFSDLGLIDWQDERYWVGDKANDFGGKIKKGKCFKYSLGLKIISELRLAAEKKQVVGSRESTAGTKPERLQFSSSSKEIILEDRFIGSRESTAGTSSERLQFSSSRKEISPIDDQILKLSDLERPVIRPTRMGWASEYWGCEAA
jgi:hypothetical protein